jgi:hypothetical protein
VRQKTSINLSPEHEAEEMTTQLINVNESTATDEFNDIATRPIDVLAVIAAQNPQGSAR